MPDSADPPPYDFKAFSGYTAPNTTQIPDEFIDRQMVYLSGAEIKVMLYIFRRTLGFRRNADNISVQQLLNGITRRDGTRLDLGTGLSKSTLMSTIRSLVEKRLIIVEQRMHPKHGSLPSTYALYLAGVNSPQERTESEQKADAERDQKPDTGGTENQYPPGTENRYSPPTENQYPPDTENQGGGSTENQYPQQTVVQQTALQVPVTNNNNNNHVAPDPKTVVVDALIEQGISKNVAEQLAKTYDLTDIQEKIEFLAYLQVNEPDTVKKPAAWLRRAIEQNYGAPDGFYAKEESARENERMMRQHQEDHANAKEKRAAEARRRQDELDILYAEFATPPQLIDAWKTVLENLKYSGKAEMYALLTNSTALTDTDDTLTVAIPSQIKLMQIEHPSLISSLQREVKQVTKRNLAIRFVLMEQLA